MTLIKFTNVNFIYNEKTKYEKHILKNINWEVKENSFHIIMGHSGSGKSTLIQHINGLFISSSGQVRVFDHIIKNTTKKQSNIFEIKKKVGMVFQFSELQLFAETVENDVIFGPMNFGFSKEKALELAKKAIKLVGLDNSYLKRSPFKLSGGEKRRVALSGILAMNPEILVLDEPTIGLDPQGKTKILNIINQLHKDGKTIILITHNIEDVWNYATDVSYLKNGEIIFCDSKENFFKNKKLFREENISLPFTYKIIQKLKTKEYNIAPNSSLNSIIEQINNRKRTKKND